MDARTEGVAVEGDAGEAAGDAAERLAELFALRGAFGVTRGPEHRLRLVNPALAALLGVRARVGRRASELLRTPGRTPLLRLLDRVYRNGVGEMLVEQPLERRRIDGRLELRHVTARCEPAYEPDGSIGGVLWLMLDVTDEVRERARTAPAASGGLAQAVAAAGVGAWHCPLPAGPVHADGQARAHLGLRSTGSLSIASVFAGLHADDRVRARAALTDAVVHRRVCDVECRAGEAGRWIRIVGRAAYDGGHVRSVAGVTLDVSARRRTAAVMVGARAALAVLAHAGDGVTARDGDGRWLFVSDGAARLFDLDGAGELPPGRWQPLDDEEAPGLLDTAAAPAGGARLVHLRDPRQGDERWLESSSHALPATDGNSDVTMQTWRAVAERHDIMTDAGLLGATLDYEATLRQVALLAVPRLADWCTVELSDGTTGHGPVPASGVRAVLRSGRIEHYPRIADEATLRAATGDDAGERERARLHGLGSALIVPLSGARGVVGALALMSARPGRYDRAALGPARELAARAALAVENAMLHAEAERARRLRDEFVTIAGHELRTPLAALQLQVQGLERATGRAALSPAQLRDRLGRLSGNVSRLERLVEGLLDVPRLATGELGMAPEPLDLAELAHTVIVRSSDEARRQRVSLTLRAPDQGVRGRWDRARMEQVLSSLIGNALKFGAGRPVTVEIIDGSAWVRVLVRDRGIGIRAPDQRRIFDRFERAVSARHYGGFGLGLWRTRQIVQALGGRVTLRSEPGVETEFAVELPR